MKVIRFQNLNLSFSASEKRVQILKNFNLEIDKGTFCVLLGPSGCGKTSLLRVAAGLQSLDKGFVDFGGKDVELSSGELGMVFQRPALFPWLTVEGNIRFALKMGSHKPATWEKTIEQLLKVVDLEKAGGKYPHELSGGMAQRASIARSLSNDPSVLLMDEPFSALDYPLRLNLQKKVREVHERFGTTTIFVTHFLEEAVALADRLIVLSAAPCKVVKDIEVDLDFPRSRSSTVFQDLVVEVAQALGLEEFD